MADAYLEIAEKAIREMECPLHPRDMLKVARESGYLPPHLHGKTQHKTMAARLSTEIRQSGPRSPFFRTAANRFFLRDLATKQHKEYRAPRREKKLHNELVLTIKDDFLQAEENRGIIPNVCELLAKAEDNDCLSYVVRRLAEKRYDVKQVIAYSIIYRSGSLLTYRRGTFSSAADELHDKRSIGFGGHVSEDDLSLFDLSGHGIIENARRELSEELLFDKPEVENLNRDDSFQFLCGLNTYETNEARKHIAITLVYFCTNRFDARKNEMSINDLRWTSLDQPENNLDVFEPWSKSILQALYNGGLKIGRS